MIQKIKDEKEFVVLNLCEVEHLYLHPDILYKFVVDSNCKRCKELECLGKIEKL